MAVITDANPASQASVALEREELFPIREVSRLTGVNPVTLRAWERRYGLIQPTRTESGHRLYSMTEIERVRSIVDWIDRGVAVSKVGKILAKTEPLKVLAHIIPDDLVQADYAQWQQQVQVAVSAFDDRALDQVYNQIFSSYSLSVVFQDILMPLWLQMLQRQDAFGQTSEWLFFDGFLRARVLQRIVALRGAQPRKVIVSALAGQCRELELLVAALFLSGNDAGVRVLTTASNDEKRGLSREAGAAESFGYEGFADRARELTGGEGVAVVYDGVGRDTFDESLRALRVRGELVLFGGASGQVPPFDLQRLNAGGSLSVTRPSLTHFMRTPEEREWRYRELFEALLDGSLRLRIGERFALADAADAHRALAGRGTTGKLILVP